MSFCINSLFLSDVTYKFEMKKINAYLIQTKVRFLQFIIKTKLYYLLISFQKYFVFFISVNISCWFCLNVNKN